MPGRRSDAHPRYCLPRLAQTCREGNRTKSGAVPSCSKRSCLISMHTRPKTGGRWNTHLKIGRKHASLLYCKYPRQKNRGGGIMDQNRIFF
jgi:hypothetical protein